MFVSSAYWLTLILSIFQIKSTRFTVVMLLLITMIQYNGPCSPVTCIVAFEDNKRSRSDCPLNAMQISITDIHIEYLNCLFTYNS